MCLPLNEMTYGVEIECLVPAGRLQVGAYHRGLENPGILPAGWKVMTDASLATRLPGYMTVEIVSPVLRGEDGLLQIVAVCTALRNLNARVNPSCGFHVHVGYRPTTVKKLGDIVHLFANVEGAVFASTGTKRREANRFCQSIKTPYRGLNWNANEVHRIGVNDRYFSLNLQNQMPGGKGTLEIRAFAGTTNVRKMIAYTRMCLAIVQRGDDMRRRAAWDQPAVASRRSTAEGHVPTLARGTGHAEMTRFFFQMGWNAGRIRNGIKYGVLGDGVAGIPSLRDSKKILLEMARKYDEVDEQE